MAFSDAKRDKTAASGATTASTASTLRRFERSAMHRLVDELRDEARCGCYADGAGTASRPAVSHHCVTCRAAERIAELEAGMREMILSVPGGQSCDPQNGAEQLELDHKLTACEARLIREARGTAEVWLSAKEVQMIRDAMELSRLIAKIGQKMAPEQARA